MSNIISREVHLTHYPTGLPTEETFKLESVELAKITDGEVLVKNTWMSVDPYMRGRMTDKKSYIAPFEVGQVLSGLCIGQIVQSKNTNFQEGDYVCSMNGWREYYISDSTGLEKVDPDLAPVQYYLSVLGMTGLTAYASLLTIGKPKAGESVFVSAASGAVGQVACQIAKIFDCHVVGSVGSQEKSDWLLTQAGIDGVVNYKEVNNLQSSIAAQCPKGIDVYFDNVGGNHLEAALNLMNNHGRIIACGMISHYNDKNPQPGPGNLMQIIAKRLKLQGFIVSDFIDLREKFLQDMSDWLKQGKIKTKETIYEGIEEAPKAFLGLFAGKNIGKMLVKID